MEVNHPLKFRLKTFSCLFSFCCVFCVINSIAFEAGVELRGGFWAFFFLKSPKLLFYSYRLKSFFMHSDFNHLLSETEWVLWLRGPLLWLYFSVNSFCKRVHMAQNKLLLMFAIVTHNAVKLNSVQKNGCFRPRSCQLLDLPMHPCIYSMFHY